MACQQGAQQPSHMLEVLALHRCRVYVLIRAQHCRSPPQRLQRLLDSGLFHLLWERPEMLDKVQMGLSSFTPEQLTALPTLLWALEAAECPSQCCCCRLRCIIIEHIAPHPHTLRQH